MIASLISEEARIKSSYSKAFNVSIFSLPFEVRFSSSVYKKLWYFFSYIGI